MGPDCNHLKKQKTIGSKCKKGRLYIKQVRYPSVPAGGSGLGVGSEMVSVRDRINPAC